MTEVPSTGVPGTRVEIAVGAVDDHPLILRGLAAYLVEHAPGIQLSLVAPTVSDLLAQPHEQVSVVLLDLHLGDGRSPGDNVRALRAAGFRVLVYTNEHRPVVIRGALDAGAVGLVLKEDPEDHLVTAIRSAHEGGFYASSRLAHQVVLDSRSALRLSEREREVLGLLARGVPWGMLARRLGMSPETARTHAYRALAKYMETGAGPVDGLKGLAFHAMADGHVDPTDPSAVVR